MENEEKPRYIYINILFVKMFLYISELAKEIEDTVANLENIDQILNDTADDLREVQALKERADRAKYIHYVIRLFSLILPNLMSCM